MVAKCVGRLGRVEGGVVVGVGCGVGHIAHAVGCSFPFFLSPFLVFLVACCGAGYFWVFRYVGECIICPSQGVFAFWVMGL